MVAPVLVPSVRLDSASVPVLTVTPSLAPSLTVRSPPPVWIVGTINVPMLTTVGPA